MLSAVASGVGERLFALLVVTGDLLDRVLPYFQSFDSASSRNEMHRQQQELRRAIEARGEGVAYTSTPYQDAFRRFVARCWRPFKNFYIAVYDLLSWFLADAIMHLRGKAYKPSSPATTQVMLDMMRAALERFGDPEKPPPFIDLGCGRGTQLPAVRRACRSDGRPLFGSVVGVELDEDTYKEAGKVCGDGVDLVCSCLFKFVDLATRARWRERRWPEVLSSAGAVFYMYEPLWAAGMPLEEVHAKYETLLSALKTRSAKAKSERERIFLIYMTGIGERHIPKEMLDRNDFQLLNATLVANSGVINTLSGTANTLEVWQLSYPWQPAGGTGRRDE